MPNPLLVTPHKTYDDSGQRSFDFSKVATNIEDKEGFVEHPYRDSKGFWTIGFGSLIAKSDEDYKKSPYYTGKITMGKSGIANKADLSGKTVTEEVARSMMMKSISGKASRASSKNMLGQKFFDLSPELQDEAISSFYRGGLSGSKKTMGFIREGKFNEAAKEFLNNNEYRAAKESGSGVASRMESLANLLNEEGRKKASFSDAVEQKIANEKL